MNSKEKKEDADIGALPIPSRARKDASKQASKKKSPLVLAPACEEEESMEPSSLTTTKETKRTHRDRRNEANDDESYDSNSEEEDGVSSVVPGAVQIGEGMDSVVADDSTIQIGGESVSSPSRSTTMPLLEARAVSEQDVIRAEVLTRDDIENLLDSAPKDRERTITTEDNKVNLQDDLSRAKRRQKILICVLVAVLVLVAGLVALIVALTATTDPDDPGDNPSTLSPTDLGQISVPSQSPTVTALPTLHPSQHPTDFPTSSPVPTTSPSPAPTDLLDQLQNILQPFFDDSFPSSELQQEALLWMANDDPANFPIMDADEDDDAAIPIADDDAAIPIMDTDADILLERYLMILFYLGTEPWTSSVGWLSGSPICDWEGVGCGLDLRITSLQQGTFSKQRNLTS